jgi:surfeit locus 1 family protein
LSRRSLLAGGAASLVGVAILVSLGVWQLHRLAWKEGLIAAADSRAHAAPTPLPPPADWPAMKPADYEYQHVSTRGTYDYAHQELIFSSLEEPRGPQGGVGYYVMTPLKLDSGETVIVDRGFVPEPLKAAADQGPRGETQVTGLLRASERRNWFTPADEPEKNLFFSRDVEALAKGMALGPHAPFVIDADAGPNPLPQGGETRLTFENNHLSYAFTWFGLAAALVAVYGAYAWGRLKAENDAPRL